MGPTARMRPVVAPTVRLPKRGAGHAPSTSRCLCLGLYRTTVRGSPPGRGCGSGLLLSDPGILSDSHHGDTLGPHRGTAGRQAEEGRRSVIRTKKACFPFSRVASLSSVVDSGH